MIIGLVAGPRCSVKKALYETLIRVIVLHFFLFVFGCERCYKSSKGANYQPKVAGFPIKFDVKTKEKGRKQKYIHKKGDYILRDQLALLYWFTLT